MSIKSWFIYVWFFLIALNSFAQDCKIKLEGEVLDKSTKLPLSFVNVIVQELSKGAISNGKGIFYLDGICAGEYHLVVSHIGCEPKRLHVSLTQNTHLTIELEHTSIALEGIVVKEKASRTKNQAFLQVNKKKIEDNSNKNLSNLLENEAGVHVLKNGSGIAKPVVHGLYGNRLTVLNNGIVQSGQQWGNDHSPEIDPLIANRITLLKGVNVLEYGGGNMGSIILVEPQNILKEPHLHGDINYAYETNGRGDNVNLQLQKYSPLIAWRVNGTFKKYGDRKSATYFLNNTGSQETNFAIQLEKSWNEKYFFDFYASTFNTQLGVLRGSHIGNLTDLKEALVRDTPFFTETNFSFGIEAPKQKVAHHLAKLSTKYYMDDTQSIHFVLAGQLNNRKEFDVRRSGRTDTPALSLKQYTFTSDVKYRKIISQKLELKAGAQHTFTDNTNNPETGILPLIPDYFSFKSGWFGTLFRTWSKLSLNLGMRYDYENQKVAAITKGVAKKIVRYENSYHNLSGVSGVKYNLFKNQTLALNAGFAMRNPAINELYSSGLHQGVSGIEEGSVDLKTEKALKTTLEYKLFVGTRFSFSSLFYYQYFNDYIFLNPQDKVRLTIRGAFPLFKYQQTNAQILGFDLSSQFTIGSSWRGILRYSFITGDNLKEQVPLVNISPNSLFTSLTYRVKHYITISNLKMKDFEFEMSNRFVFKQMHLLAKQDFVAPPGAYNLLGLKASGNIISPMLKLRVFTKVENLLNTKYRDYLNRQRYFANDLGISITFGVNLKF